MTAPSAARPASVSSTSPFSNRDFRALWTGALGSHVGTWMQNVAAAWLMTSLTTSPALVALVQTATSLPIFLLALPSGALADIVNRRRLLLATQSWMCAVALTLSVLTFAGAITPWALLLLTFTLGLGAALTAPAWQAATPEVVPREQLPAAVALNAAAFNGARAVGPALGGVVVGAVGPAAAFLLNAASYIGVITAVFRWRPAASVRDVPGERFTGAIRAGVRYARHSPPLRTVMIRAGASVLFATAVWALLPVLARERFGLGSTGYGLLLGSLGAGAVVSAAFLTRLHGRFGMNGVVNGSVVVFALAMAWSATTRSAWLAGPMLLAGGAAWVGMVSTFNITAQLGSPAWVRARALAAFMLVSQGGMAAGSALWGLVASAWSVQTALLVASAGLVATLALSRRFPIGDQPVDLSPSGHWQRPRTAVEPERHLPVLVTVEYRVGPDRAGEFAAAMLDLRTVRRRDGADNWGLFRDLADPDRFVETFLVESWDEHLRQHARVTVRDREIQARVRACHSGPGDPVVSHLVAAVMPRRWWRVW